MKTEAFFEWQGQTLYRIDDSRQMPEFFMTQVSPSNHWMFISSRGALTAGRGDPEHALFPYNTVDKIYSSRGFNGPRTLLRVAGHRQVWEPFADWTPQVWKTRQAIARNAQSSLVVFFETNEDLGLEFAYSWRFSRRFGFVRTCYLKNLVSSAVSVEVVDGLLNLVSTGVSRQQITEFSCLIDAYKDNSLIDSRMAVYSLSALVTDKAEAAEALEATVAWTLGMETNMELGLDRAMAEAFFGGQAYTPKRRVCGQTNDFIAKRSIKLAPGADCKWMIAADRDLDAAAVAKLAKTINAKGFGLAEIEADIDQGEADLRALLRRSDAWNWSAKPLQAWHHQSNVLFNIMRGGLPWHDTAIETNDLLAFIAARNKSAAQQAHTMIGHQASWEYRDCVARLQASGQADLVRLGSEYLPLTFSRRHGDPSRPWNNFAIKVEDAQGKKIVQYQGNWRDIFQNWEALALSFPDYLPAFIANFLNATSLDGYNPYRVTREGSDWEKLEPHNPWSNIGYWSDHQIIYLQKLVELAEAYQPGWIARNFDQERYSYTAIPYRLADFETICQDPKHTIAFDEAADQAIENRRGSEGNDARLVHAAGGSVYHGSLIEKFLTLVLAKLTNLVPGGGIWMNTQRPEWNDANNALVGNGLSVVSLAQLRRTVVYWQKALAELPATSIALPAELVDLSTKAQAIMARLSPQTCAEDQGQRWEFMQAMGQAASVYRQSVYAQWRFSGQKTRIELQSIVELLGHALRHIDASLSLQKRSDGLFHSYNILSIDQSGPKTLAQVKPLQVMLEGQVAILGAGYLSGEKTVELVRALRNSDLFRNDQYSYMLYPKKELLNFSAKNLIKKSLIKDNPLLAKLAEIGDSSILTQGEDYAHFAHGLSNHRLLEEALQKLAGQLELAELVRGQKAAIHALYEDCFGHQAYMGRSGTMYAYEGIGSIYWHMVSKLLVAVAENCAQQTSHREELALREAYLDIRQGIGYRKSAAAYGAFPWEPYSHTPMGAGARQPGMTGQVKEEILTRFWECGLAITQGCLEFKPAPLMADEVAAAEVEVPDYGLVIPAGNFGCSVCGIPIIRGPGAVKELEICIDGNWKAIKGSNLGREYSDLLFGRLGRISAIRAHSAHN